MNDFAAYLQQWHPFFTTMVVTAATLMGLIFLAVSLHIELFKQTQSREPKQIAWQTFVNFLTVIFVGVLFLIPGMSPPVFGVMLAILGLAGTIIVVRRWVRAAGHLPLGRALIAFIPVMACNLGMVIAGVFTAFSRTGALVAMAPIVILLLGMAVYDAWDLVIER
jgi:hypothetical protein